MSGLLYLLPSVVFLILFVVWVWRIHPSLMCESRNRMRLESLAITGVVVFGFLFIFGVFLFGPFRYGYRDMGLDTVDVYAPFYIDLINSIKSGQFGLWNHSYGVGASVLSYQSWILDPFNLFVVPMGVLFGAEHLSTILVCAQGLKILAAALTFDCLLTRFSSMPLARILGAVSYGFCGFLLLWGQHYWLGGVAPLFAVLLLALERSMEGKGRTAFLGVVVAVTVSVAWSPYIGFMELVGAAIYALFRLIHRAPQGRRFPYIARWTARLFAPVFIGCLIASVTLVPYAMYLFTETARTSAGGSMASRAVQFAGEFVPLDWLPALASRLLGNGLMSCGAPYPEGLISAAPSFAYVNTYEFVSLGFGTLVLVAIFQFFDWLLKDAPKVDRVLCCLAAGLVVLYCCNFFLPGLLNLFVAPKFRSAFIVAVPICIAIALAFEHRVLPCKIARGPFWASVLMSAGILLWSFFVSVDGRRLAALDLVFLLLFAVCASVAFSRGRLRVRAFALCFLFVGAVMIDGLFVTCNRTMCTDVDFPASSVGTSADTEQALAFIRERDHGFYRVEKTYTDWGLYNDALVQGYAGVASYNSTVDGDVLEFYRQLWPASLGSAGAVQNFRFDPAGLDLLPQVGVRYLLSKDDLHASQYAQIASFGVVRVYEAVGESSLLSARAAVMGEGEVIALPGELERRNALDCALSVPDEDFAHLSEQSTGNANTPAIVSNLRRDGSTIYGDVSLSSDAFVCASVPFTEGWSVRVDGVETETFRANFGFVGFYAESGAHTIELTYELPGLHLGMIASLAGVLACAAMLARMGATRR